MWGKLNIGLVSHIQVRKMRKTIKWLSQGQITSMPGYKLVCRTLAVNDWEMCIDAWGNREKKDPFVREWLNFIKALAFAQLILFSKILVYIGFKDKQSLGFPLHMIKTWERGKCKSYKKEITRYKKSLDNQRLRIHIIVILKIVYIVYFPTFLLGPSVFRYRKVFSIFEKNLSSGKTF